MPCPYFTAQTSQILGGAGFSVTVTAWVLRVRLASRITEKILSRP